MAHVWMHGANGEARGDELNWVAVPLDGEAFDLSEGAPAIFDGAPCERMMAVLRRRIDASEAWFLLAGPAVRVNATPLFAGLRLLRDRDELRIPLSRGGAARLYFSTERLARVDVFPGADRVTCCPRCKQAIVPGTPSVLCPRCGVWHHEARDLGCFTYSERCAACGGSTDMTANYRWSPEVL